jgi:transcriptional antiterminator NusG
VSEFEEERAEAVSDEEMTETAAAEAEILDSDTEAGEIEDSLPESLAELASEDAGLEEASEVEEAAAAIELDEAEEPAALEAMEGVEEDGEPAEEALEEPALPEPAMSAKAKNKAEDEVKVEEEAEEELQPAGEPDDGRHWYVVHCYSGYENKVRHNLEQRIETMNMKTKIFDVVVPTEEEIEVKDGKRRTVERRVFPGYILVQMLMDEDSWYVVRNTPGVTGFVGMGNDPTPLRPEEVSSIVKRMEAEAPRIKVTYKTGQKVRIIDGPFNDFIGTVSDIDMERAKVRVMVSFFGRETPVELDFLQVEKA